MLALCAVAPATAHASVVTVSSRYVIGNKSGGYVEDLALTAGTGEANDVVLAWDRRDLIVRDAAGLTAGDGCRAVSAHEARCAAASPETLTADLGDGNDALRDESPLGRLTAAGGPGDDRLAGDGTLSGGDGDDVLAGGEGPDLLDGGTGRDEISGGGGDDTASYAGRAEPVHLDLDGEADDGADGEGDRIGPDVERLAGGDGDDVLAGDERDNWLIGGPGRDRLEGGAGADELNGGPGDDSIDGGAGRDFVLAGGGADQVSGGPGPDLLDGDIDSDGPYEPGPDSVDGGPGDDRIFGRGGADVLTGGPGKDTIEGEADGATVLARDGEPDLVGCSQPAHPAGGATLDAGDLARGCPTLDRNGPARPRVLVLGQWRYDPDHVVRLVVGCPQDIAAGCRGRVRIALHGRTVGGAVLRVAPGTARVYRPRVALPRGADPCVHRDTIATVALRDAEGRPFTVRRALRFVARPFSCGRASTRIDGELWSLP